MNLTIDVDSKALQSAFRKAPATTVMKLNLWINKTAMMTEREAKGLVPPKVDTGRLQSSIHTTFAPMRAVVKPQAEYGKWVIRGRRPGRRMPPWGPGTDLDSWARRKGMNSFLLARSIGKKGIRPHPFMDEAYRIVKPRAEAEGRSMLNEIVRSI